MRKMINKAYPPKIITYALTAYNLGSTLEESAKTINRRFKTGVTKSSVHRWVEEFKGICTYHKIRPLILKNYDDRDMLFSKVFEHNGLAYDFKYHKPKLELLCNGFSPLIDYIKGFEDGCPKYFGDIQNRCSGTRINVKITRQGKYNNACRLAELALNACERNKERHSSVENFMLANDSSTIACEVPVWLWEKNLDTGLSGHIDMLQIRNNKIYILDFKPDAAFENEQKVASQLFFYASGLSFRTRIPLERFACAWFDETVYFEFDPSTSNVRFPDSKWRSKKR